MYHSWYRASFVTEKEIKAQRCGFPSITQDVEDQGLGPGILAFPLTLLFFEQAKVGGGEGWAVGRGCRLKPEPGWNNFLLHRRYQ